jgi:hypothetical protein
MLLINFLDTFNVIGDILVFQLSTSYSTSPSFTGRTAPINIADLK